MTRPVAGNTLGTTPLSLLRTPSHVWIGRQVAFLVTTDNIGGLERLAIRLASELRNRGTRIRFVCQANTHVSRKCDELGFEHNHLKVRNSGDISAAKLLAQYLIQHDIGILHAHSRKDFVTAVLAVKIARRKMHIAPKLVLHVHQIRRLGEGGRLADLFFNWGADKVLAVSGAVKKEICRGSWLNSLLVDVLLNGVDENEFPKPESNQASTMRAKMRQIWSIPESAPVIGMVGRLDEKGQPFVIGHIPEILERIPDAHLVLIGPTDNVGAMSQLEPLYKDAPFKDRVVLAGNISNMPAAYAAMDLLVHLPVDEAFGLVVAEAMASSLPVIVSRIGGCTELVRNQVSGILIEPRDSDALIDNIVSILDDSSHRLRKSLGITARRSIENHFTIERQTDQLVNIYDSIFELSR